MIEAVVPGRACRTSTTRSRWTSSADGENARRSSARCSSTSATTACAPWRWTPPTACARGVEVRDTGGADHGAGRQGRRSAASSTCSASRSTRAATSRPTSAGRSTATRPSVEDLTPTHGDPRDRHQGRRPARALRQGRQGRPVRRRRRRQDGADPGADPQHRRRSTRACPRSAAWASARARATTSGSR